DGGQWPIASDSPRPVAGDYVLEFDGTVAGPGLSERRVLPDGDYQVVLEVDSGRQHQQAQVPLHVRDADSRIPDIADLPLLPARGRGLGGARGVDGGCTHWPAADHSWR